MSGKCSETSLLGLHRTGMLLVLNSHMAFYKRSEQSEGLKEVQGIWRAAAKQIIPVSSPPIVEIVYLWLSRCLEKSHKAGSHHK